MKNVLLLLLLLNFHTSEVHSQPYRVDGNCNSPATEYKLDGSNLCCKKCQPGERLKEECSNDSETVCEPCPKGQYIESWNYSPNCFPCKKCKFSKGLVYIQNCSAQNMSKCKCQPDMYCTMRIKEESCSSCAKYRSCQPGYGVSKPGTAASDVTCVQCAVGTFSDTSSSTETCQPHKRCDGRVTKVGNATADTACQPKGLNQPLHPPAEVVTTSTSAEAVPSDPVVTPITISPSAPEVFFNHSLTTIRPLLSSMPDEQLALIICIPVLALVCIAAILLCSQKRIWRKDAGKCHPEVDTNGNCGPGEKMNGAHFVNTRLMSLNMTSAEQECLLDKREASGSINQSHSSRSTDTLTRTENRSSFDSIGPLQPTLALHDPHSEASESMTLFSTEEALPPHGSIHGQSSSLPATPKIISPVTTSPHVNVNITFHIGNGSGGAPKVAPTDLQVDGSGGAPKVAPTDLQADPQLPFGEEEEASGTLQQEAGKQFVMPVQESSD